MPLKWLDARKAAEAGSALAEDFVGHSAPAPSGQRKHLGHDARRAAVDAFLAKFWRRVDSEARVLRLNIFQSAQLANSFKWRLLEQGVEREVADELTGTLVVALRGKKDPQLADDDQQETQITRASRSDAALLQQGNACMTRGAWEEAASAYHELLGQNPQHAAARNNLGAAYCKLGRYRDAEEQFRTVVGFKPGDADAHSNLGTVMRWRGRVLESEAPLRRALKLKPT